MTADVVDELMQLVARLSCRGATGLRESGKFCRRDSANCGEFVGPTDIAERNDSVGRFGYGESIRLDVICRMRRLCRLLGQMSAS